MGATSLMDSHEGRYLVDAADCPHLGIRCSLGNICQLFERSPAKEVLASVV